MRRLIILLMLCMLPVQISWAAISDYCSHESTSQGQHGVHHHAAHDFAVSVFDLDLPSQSSDPDQAKFGHDHCHLAGFIGLLTTVEMRAAIAPDLLFMQGESSVFSSQILDRPERPKWFLLA